MAKAHMQAVLQPVTLELSGDEAAALYSYLVYEEWPKSDVRQETLNIIYAALNDVGVVLSR